MARRGRLAGVLIVVAWISFFACPSKAADPGGFVRARASVGAIALLFSQGLLRCVVDYTAQLVNTCASASSGLLLQLKGDGGHRVKTSDFPQLPPPPQEEDDLNPENVAEDAFFVSDRARPVSSMKAQPRVVARGNGGPAFRIAEAMLPIATGGNTTVFARGKLGAASAMKTVATGAALRHGVVGIVHEEQLITAIGTSGVFCVSLLPKAAGGKLACVVANLGSENVTTNAEFEAALEPIAGKVTVSSVDSPDENTRAWTVTFISTVGDVDRLIVHSTGLKKGEVIVEELVKGKANEISISPRTKNGKIATKGDEIFITDVHKLDAKGHTKWVSDSGVARFNRPIYEKQRISMPAGSSGSFCLLFEWEGTVFSTPDGAGCLKVDAGAAALKNALSTIDVIGAADVTFSNRGEGDGFAYSVTFRSLLGNLPLLLYQACKEDPLFPGDILIEEISAGVTEVQKIVVSSSGRSAHVTQSFELISNGISPTMSGTFDVTTDGASNNVTVPFDATAGQLEALLKKLSNVNDVSVFKSGDSSHWAVEFLYPFDVDIDVVPQLEIDTSNLVGAFSHVHSAEKVQGVSHLEGENIHLSYQNSLTKGLPFDASALDVKNALESLDTISMVSVDKHRIDTGFEWWVTFRRDSGNLDLVEAHACLRNVQSLVTYGTSRTPGVAAFNLRHRGSTSVKIPHDASTDVFKAALEPIIGSAGHLLVSKQDLDEERTQWLVTFKDRVGDMALLGVRGANLGDETEWRDATKVKNGKCASPFLAVEELQPGRPSYTTSYEIPTAGNYKASIYHLLPGGLEAKYWDNARMVGNPAVHRVDPQVSFNWGFGAITPNSRDHVSVQWRGKVLAPASEKFMLFVRADDAVRLFFDHELVIDAWKGNLRGNTDHFAWVELTKGSFHDIVLEYREDKRASSIQLMWTSPSTKPAVVPAEALYYGTPIMGSTFDVSVSPDTMWDVHTELMPAGPRTKPVVVPAEAVHYKTPMLASSLNASPRMKPEFPDGCEVMPSLPPGDNTQHTYATAYIDIKAPWKWAFIRVLVVIVGLATLVWDAYSKNAGDRPLARASSPLQIEDVPTEVKSLDIMTIPARGILNIDSLGGYWICFNRCFLSAVVQALASEPQIYRLVIDYRGSQNSIYSKTTADDDQKKGTLLLELAAVFEALSAEGCRRDPLNINGLEAAMRNLLRSPQDGKADPMGRDRKQCDAGETLFKVVEALTMAFPGVQVSPEYEAPAKELAFMIPVVQTSISTCFNCGTVSTRNNAMPVITVPMLQPKACEIGLLEQQCMGLQSCRGAALQAAKKKLKKAKSDEARQVKYILATSGKTEVEYMLRQEYGARETIEGVACSSCSTKATRDRWSELTGAPDVLLLHLLRFSGSMIGEKLNRDMTFPVGEFNVDFAGSTGSPKKKVSYIATAVVRHHGNDSEKGHYTTVVRKCTSPTSEWWKYDDSTVSTSLHTEVTKDAYVVILRRFDSILTK